MTDPESTRLPPRRPTQAVILAGGRGTRMRPWTDVQPKAMIPVAGKPFLEHVVEMLRDQGFDRVLLLLGYMPEVFQQYFGDGRRWGVRIEYSVSAAEDLTLRRVQLARDRLDPCFLLLYCDNYWPMAMDRMWQRFLAAGAPAMVTVYRNRDGYSRDCVRVDEEGMVTAFDRARTLPDLEGVEISYAVLTSEALDLVPPGTDALIEDAVYPALLRDRRLAAYLTEHRYYSVGSPSRLELTRDFFARRPAILLDRDGVLNRRPPRGEYVRDPAGFEWLPGAREALGLFHRAGYRVIVVSNQAGIARGAMTEADLGAINLRMTTETREAGGRIDALYHCPHDWDAGCECRKPRPGMLFQAQRDFSLDLTRTPFIGDDERDGEAAEAAGCPFIRVSDQHSLHEATLALLGGPTAEDAGVPLDLRRRSGQPA